MDHLVKYVTQTTPPRPGAGKERKRSRVNRKSCKCLSCVLSAGSMAKLVLLYCPPECARPVLHQKQLRSVTHSLNVINLVLVWLTLEEGKVLY